MRRTFVQHNNNIIRNCIYMSIPILYSALLCVDEGQSALTVEMAVEAPSFLSTKTIPMFRQ